MSKEKRYDGPDGVFYDAKFDELFILEWNGRETINLKTFEKTGKLFNYYTSEKIVKNVAIAGLEHCCRIGDL